MAAIIRVRDKNGNVIDIPAIVGAPGEKGETGAQGEKGDKGDPGANGANGEDGYTPLRGTDYWTEADKAEILKDVLEQFPTGGCIEVSGATVGQTVKISAVDEEGVPTAWEPVDMPSGEKAWESISYDFTAAGVVAVKLELPRGDITEATLTLRANGTNSSKMSGRIYGDVEVVSGAADNWLGTWDSMYITERTMYLGYKECGGEDKVTAWSTDFAGSTIKAWMPAKNRPKKYLYFATNTADSTFSGTATLYYR